MIYAYLHERAVSVLFLPLMPTEFLTHFFYISYNISQVKLTQCGIIFQENKIYSSMNKEEVRGKP
jgi:hypothetical protein